jgi:hypothetical protein
MAVMKTVRAMVASDIIDGLFAFAWVSLWTPPPSVFELFEIVLINGQVSQFES